MPDSAPSDTRADILTAIRTASTPPTVEDLAIALDLHPNSVRLHVTALRHADLITQKNRSNGMRGRPVTTYETTTHGAWTGDRNYEQLAAVLMNSIRDSAEDPTAEARRAGHMWGRQLATHGETSADMVVRVLHECGFEPVPNKGVIELRNCPFADLVDTYQDMVCGLHTGMLDGLVENRTSNVELVPFSSPITCSVRITA